MTFDNEQQCFDSAEDWPSSTVKLSDDSVVRQLECKFNGYYEPHAGNQNRPYSAEAFQWYTQQLKQHEDAVILETDIAQSRYDGVVSQMNQLIDAALEREKDYSEPVYKSMMKLWNPKKEPTPVREPEPGERYEDLVCHGQRKLALCYFSFLKDTKRQASPNLKFTKSPVTVAEPDIFDDFPTHFAGSYP